MNLLITGAYQYTQKQMDVLKEMFSEVDFLQYEKDDVINPEKYDAVICNGLFLHHDIKKFTNLKYIQLTSAGFDRVPMEYIKENGIQIHNARGVYSIPMAEFAVSGVLQLYKKASYFAENQKKHKWEKSRDLKELYGKNVLIAGCGSVGDECAKRFSVFGCNVNGVDIYPCQKKEYQNISDISELDKMLENSDIVVLTLPLTDMTKNLINAERFMHFKDKAVLVNIARGAIVDTEALCKALEEKLEGAVLDVFEDEPLEESSQLWDMENVIITPHNSFVGEGNAQRMFDVIYDNLKEYVKRRKK